MSEVLSANQMRALENAAIDSGAVTGLELMERAGQGVVDAIFNHWPDLGKIGQAIVLCGPGNNGGDGFVIARLLQAIGWEVTVFFYGESALLPPDARANYDKWQSCAAGKMVQWSFPQVSQNDIAGFAEGVTQSSSPTLIIDALFGIGLTRPLTALLPIFNLCASENDDLSRPKNIHCVSVDLPSGLAEEPWSSFDGPAVFQADLTVTFHRRKLAHGHGASFCGKIVVQDIGL